MRGDGEKRSEVEITLEIVEHRVLPGTYLAFTKFISDFYKKKKNAQMKLTINDQFVKSKNIGIAGRPDF